MNPNGFALRIAIFFAVRARVFGVGEKVAHRWIAGICAALLSGSILSSASEPRAPLVTNVAQFKIVSAAEYAVGCDFRLTGVVTLLDTNRNLIVLQDETGAVGLNAPIEFDLKEGEAAVIAGSNGAPAFERFPEFPHRPAFTETRQDFEAPSNAGEYYLARMRGWLRPSATGDYTFWVASDNSSELWLSPDADPSKAKLISTVPRYGWVNSREWSKFPTQRSEKIRLEAGQSYYIEAMQEQSQGDAHLAVAWEGPGIERSVIDAPHLTPWTRDGIATIDAATHGILFERWNNYTAGALSGLGGVRSFQSVLSVEKLHLIERRPASAPRPRAMSFDGKWLADHNLSWVETEGMVTFAGETGNHLQLALDNGKSQAQVRSLQGQSIIPKLPRHAAVRVQGVCEAFFDENGGLIPGVIWIRDPSNISVIEKGQPSSSASAPGLDKAQANQSPALEAFYGTRGVVTFNDRVFGTDCLFVQEGNAVAFVKITKFKNQLKVGDWVDLGGALEPERFFPTVKPMVVVPLGFRPMPAPITDPIELPIPGNRDGRWTEIEGVGRFVKTNSTLELMTGTLPISVWIGGTTSNELSRYVDAKLRIRGVLTAAALETPTLLVPSRSFVEIEEAAPIDPFGAPLRAVADLKEIDSEPCCLHRVRVAGEVTLLDHDSFVLQDASGGVRVVPIGNLTAHIGDRIEVVGFPLSHSARPLLDDALVRPGNDIRSANPAELDLVEALPVHQDGSLVKIAATLLAARTIGNSQVLELQEGRRVFTATLTTKLGRFPALIPGSRLAIVGVCDTDSAAPPGITAREKAGLASINLWLRSPSDIKVLSGPPWWSWQRATALIGTLFAVLTGALLWIHLLRLRLERQKAAQLAASEQILKRLEEERRRIAANLHDSLGQVLLAIKNQALVGLQRANGDTIIRERLNEISGATSQAIEEVRQITHGLRPYQLDRLGLTQAMRATVSSASANSSISFASRVEDIDGAFDKDSEIHVYRIVQEAINNILKHSAATEAAVVIKKRAHNVSLSIRDNGRGFELGTKRASQPNGLGYGLTGIAERMRILKGRLTIDSQPGEGASLNLEIPHSSNGPGNHHPDRG